jgi:ribosomal protein S27E
MDQILNTVSGSPSRTTVDCPDCAHPMVLSEFLIWGAQGTLKTLACAECGSTVTYPTAPDGALDVSHAPIGRAVHGTTREERAMETLASRPTLEQQA